MTMTLFLRFVCSLCHDHTTTLKLQITLLQSFGATLTGVLCNKHQVKDTLHVVNEVNCGCYLVHVPPWLRGLEIQLGLFGQPIWLSYRTLYMYMYTVHNWLAFTGFLVFSFHFGFLAVKFHTGFLWFMLIQLMYIF